MENNINSCCSRSQEECCKDNNEEYITLLLENEQQLKCNILSIFEVDNKKYIALLPLEEEQILLFQYIEYKEKNGFDLLNIETQEEFEKIEKNFFDIFDKELFREDKYDYIEYE